jgi:hypothetical protein
MIEVIDELHTRFLLEFDIQLSNKLLVPCQEQLIHGEFPFQLVLKILSFKDSPKERPLGTYP